MDETIEAGMRELRRHQVLSREQWLKEAERCESKGSPRMSEAIQVVVSRLASCSSKRQAAIQISCEVSTALRALSSTALARSGTSK